MAGRLLDPLKLYLTAHRPLLASLRSLVKTIGNALWVSSDGSPMTEMALYDRVRKHTADAFGVGINPHLFRDAAATTLAIEDPEHVRVAAPLLGHRTFATTEKYYQQAKAFEAHHAYVEVLFPMKKGRTMTRQKKDAELYEVRFPEPDAWIVLSKDLQLTKPQANVLKKTVREFVDNIEIYRSPKTSRPRGRPRRPPETDGNSARASIRRRIAASISWAIFCHTIRWRI